MANVKKEKKEQEASVNRWREASVNLSPFKKSVTFEISKKKAKSELDKEVNNLIQDL